MEISKEISEALIKKARELGDFNPTVSGSHKVEVSIDGRKSIEDRYWQSFKSLIIEGLGYKYNITVTVECNKNAKIMSVKSVVINMTYGVILIKESPEKRDIDYMINFFSGNWNT